MAKMAKIEMDPYNVGSPNVILVGDMVNITHIFLQDIGKETLWIHRDSMISPFWVNCNNSLIRCFSWHKRDDFPYYRTIISRARENSEVMMKFTPAPPAGIGAIGCMGIMGAIAAMGIPQGCMEGTKA